MKGTFFYYIDAFLFAIILGFVFKGLEYLKVNLNPIYIIGFTLVIYVTGKIIVNRLVRKKSKDTNSLF